MVSNPYFKQKGLWEASHNACRRRFNLNDMDKLMLLN